MPHVKYIQALISLGGNIKQLRTAKNITQSQLAKNCNMQRATLCKIEKGMVNISFITLYRLALGLNVDIENITGE